MTLQINSFYYNNLQYKCHLVILYSYSFFTWHDENYVPVNFHIWSRRRNSGGNRLVSGVNRLVSGGKGFLSGGKGFVSGGKGFLCGGRSLSVEERCGKWWKGVVSGGNGVSGG